jgi:hypothetical protein
MYKQVHRAVIREAVAVLKESPDCPTAYTVGTASDLSDLQLQAFPSKQKQRSYDHRSLPAQLHRDDTMSSATETNAPKEICGICIPNTPLVLAATEFVSRFTPLWLMNHLFRTYVFAELLGRKSGLKYDPEILYLSAIMHDLGLIHEFAGSQRFELDGADAARLFLLKQGVSMAGSRLVWNAIAFHTSSGIYDRMKPQIALLGFGFLADVTGERSENIPARHVRRVLDTWPRHGFKYAYPQRIVEIMGRKSQTAVGSFAADLLRDHGIAVPTVCEVIATAPF